MGAGWGIFRRIGLFLALLALLLAYPAAGPAQAQQTENPGNEAGPKPEGEAGAGEQVPGGVEEKADDNEIAKPDASAAPAEILRDLALLPFPARRMHELLVEAAKSGDIEKLRPFIGTGEDATMLSLGGLDGDPITFLKSQSGDPDGHEILAILLEVLESGFVHLDAGTENDVYVWPYFFAVPLDALTPQQRVELFTILTSGDLEEMKTYGAYVFFRVGISPEGRWRFFVAGD
jgi:hypothetical protein